MGRAQRRFFTGLMRQVACISKPCAIGGSVSKQPALASLVPSLTCCPTSPYPDSCSAA